MSATKRLCAAVLALLLTVLAAPPSASAAPPVFTLYNQMAGSQYASLSRTPRPRAVVECGPFSNPNLGCTDERQDAIAAYTLALIWYITQDSRYATKAISIMDAWSATIRDHTNSNAPLQTAWSAASWTRAAEIIRHTYPSWPNATRFATMLRGVYLPEIVNGAATTRVPAFVYLPSDGALPKAPPGNLCGGSVQRGLGPVTEVGYNHLHTRLGITMPNTQTLTESRRPAGTNNLFVAWQTLTHANNPTREGTLP